MGCHGFYFAKNGCVYEPSLLHASLCPGGTPTWASNVVKVSYGPIELSVMHLFSLCIYSLHFLQCTVESCRLFVSS